MRHYAQKITLSVCSTKTNERNETKFHIRTIECNSDLKFHRFRAVYLQLIIFHRT